MFTVWHTPWSAEQAGYLALSAPQLRMRRQLTFSACQQCLGRRRQHVSNLPRCSVTCRLLPPQSSKLHQHRYSF